MPKRIKFILCSHKASIQGILLYNLFLVKFGIKLLTTRPDVVTYPPETGNIEFFNFILIELTKMCAIFSVCDSMVQGFIGSGVHWFRGSLLQGFSGSSYFS